MLCASLVKPSLTNATMYSVVHMMRGCEDISPVIDPKIVIE